jgi:hypothetical protein
MKTISFSSNTGFNSLLKKSFFSDCSKMPPARAGRGARGAFHLPVRQAILSRERFKTVPYDVAATSLPRA